jgi:hypothetical protein
MAEALSIQFYKEIPMKIILGIKITQGERRINHSQFADDTLILGGASTIVTKIFKEILDEFM